VIIIQEKKLEFINDKIEDIFFDSIETDSRTKKYPKSVKTKGKKKEKPISQPELPVNEIFKSKQISPLTKTQKEYFISYCEADHLVGHGSAGTGKSFLSVYLAMQDVLNGNYSKLVIIRSALPSRNVGFLPGTEKEKIEVYERPYIAIFEELFGKKNSYELLKKRGLVEFESTSFLRGNTFNDCVLLYDEYQNGNWMESVTVLTRVGKNCKVVLCGDHKQSDHDRSVDRDGINKLMTILKRMKSVDFIEFTSADIVRSGFVKEFIIACEKEGY
jgi:phosphate starvation-inducible PhoH-like protein